MSNQARKHARLDVNINQQTEEALGRYCAKHGVTMTEAIRRFVGIADVIIRAVDDGKDVLLRKGDETERLVFSF